MAQRGGTLLAVGRVVSDVGVGAIRTPTIASTAASRSRVAMAIVVLAVVMMLATMVGSATPAQAYVHTWDCNGGNTAYAQCYDFSGQQYNPWVYTSGAYGSPLPSGYNGLCVKARTSSGTIKSGSSCFPASVYAANVPLQAYPVSQGYYYFGGSGISYNNAGRSGT